MKWLSLLLVTVLLVGGQGALLADEDPKGGDEARASGKEVLPVGAEAPPVDASTWLNTEQGESPVPESLEGKLLLVEFWGTWCGPCVRSMPKIQALHETFADRGLIVVAITRETASEVRGFLKEKDYTMPVGCDPSQSCISKYQVSSWPTTYLVGGNSTILFAGSPYGAERAVEQALGLESSPATLLTQFLDACATRDADAKREHLERLALKAGPVFDLRSWAAGALDKVPAEAAKPRKLDGGKALHALVRKWTTDASERRTLAALEIAQHGPTDFDLEAWARALFGKRYPLRSKEVSKLLEGTRYRQLLDALLDRNPSASVVKKAGKHEGFAAWCDKHAGERRTFARKAVMGSTYWLSGKRPPEGMDHRAFSRDLGVSGWSERTDPETGQKSIAGISIGGEMIMKEQMPGYIHRQLCRSIVMDAVASGHKVKTDAVRKKARKEEAKILDALYRKYGKPRDPE